MTITSTDPCICTIQLAAVCCPPPACLDQIKHHLDELDHKVGGKFKDWCLFRFMAPEVLSSKVLPASDVWAAGVLAYQLLCGSLPFDDAKGSLPKIWKAILSSEPSFGGSVWHDISLEAKDFVRSLLNK